MEKSANKQYKEYSKNGGTLTFKEWIDRENKKNEGVDISFIPFDGIQIDTSSIDKTLQQANDDLKAAGGYKTQQSTNKVFGLDKNILILSGVLIVGSIGLYIYNKSKQK
jgi:hypothetical protein